MYMYIFAVLSIIWSGYYLILRRLNSNCSAEWNSRIVAMTHALTVCRCIEYTMLFDCWPFDNMGEVNTKLQNLTLCLTAGYFVFEILWCLYMQTEGFLMLLHHGISISAMIGSVLTQRSASEVLLTTWGSELTNPFLQIRWFLRETNHYNTTYGFINDVIFVVLFTVIRLGVGTCVAYYLYLSTKTVFLMKVCGFSFYILSLVWLVQIFGMAQRSLFGGLEKRKAQ